MNDFQQKQDGKISHSNLSSQDNTLKYPEPYRYQNPYNTQYQFDSMNENQYTNGSGNYRAASPSQYRIGQTNGNGNQQPNNNYYPQQSNSQQGYNSPRMPTKDSEIRDEMDSVSKQVYKRQLDQQVAEKQASRYNQERERKHNELALIPQYPFGKRTNPSYLVEESNAPFQNQGYNPSFNNQGYSQPNLNEPFRYQKLDKDRLFAKPNSLVDDVPPYDPVKEVKMYNAPEKYDPWGKPGGGAPLIDPDTGKKYTKISGQLFYDTLGMSPSARQKFRDDNRMPVNINDQKIEMEVEAQRRKYEDQAYKARAGDVATWIQDIEGQRWPLRTHLNHTNVTRDKVNLEYARRDVNERTKKYHDELGLQLEEKERQTKLHKLKDDVAGIEHTRKWNDWWGKPGGGAPNPDRRRHEILEQLESPRPFWDRNGSSQAVSNGTSLPMTTTHLPNELLAGSVLFAKGTNKSNHKNFYEHAEKMK